MVRTYLAPGGTRRHLRAPGGRLLWHITSPPPCPKLDRTSSARGCHRYGPTRGPGLHDPRGPPAPCDGRPRGMLLDVGFVGVMDQPDLRPTIIGRGDPGCEVVDDPGALYQLVSDSATCQ